MIHTVISFLLRNRAVPSAIKNQVLTGAIAGISGVPLTASISVESDGSIMIHGKKLSALDMQALRESADGALNSYARSVVRDHVRFVAINNGFLKNDNLDTQVFYKAALWFSQEEDRVLSALSKAGVFNGTDTV